MRNEQKHLNTIMEAQKLQKNFKNTLKEAFKDATSARTHKIDIKKLRKKFKLKVETLPTPEIEEQHYDPKKHHLKRHITSKTKPTLPYKMPGTKSRRNFSVPRGSVGTSEDLGSQLRVVLMQELPKKTNYQ